MEPKLEYKVTWTPISNMQVDLVPPDMREWSLFSTDIDGDRIRAVWERLVPPTQALSDAGDRRDWDACDVIEQGRRNTWKWSVPEYSDECYDEDRRRTLLIQDLVCAIADLDSPFTVTIVQGKKVSDGNLG